MSRHYAVDEDLFIDLYQAAKDEAAEETLMEARRTMREEYLPNYDEKDAEVAFALLVGVFIGYASARPGDVTYHDLESLYPEVTEEFDEPL